MCSHRSREGLKCLRPIVVTGILTLLSMTPVLAQSTTEAQPPAAKTAPANSSDKVPFDDEPHFAVSGVKDTSALGGHGSDTMVRARDSLAKGTASLGKSESSQPAPSRATLESLRERAQREPNNAEVHHMLADAEESAGDPLAALREYQRAAELSEREDYFFDWGAELLLHHAPEPAMEVFAKGHRLAPGSTRMLLGVGATEFTLGNYDKAVEEISTAADLNPNDPTPYLFLGGILDAETVPPDGLIEELRRFVSLQPDRADANYYYALALWKTRKTSGGREASMRSLLDRAIQLDPKDCEAFLLRGLLFAEQGDDTKAIADYQRAISADPRSEDPHERLAQAYRRLGEDDKAKAEIKTYDELSMESKQQAERERHEIRQFVYTLRDKTPSSQ